MKKPFLPVHKIFAATIAGISLASLVAAQPSWADPNQPFGNLDSDRNSNILSPSNSDFNMFDLIHRANLGNVQWNQDQKNNELNDAATEFQAKQRQRLQGQGQQQNPTPNVNTSGNNNLPIIVLPQSK
jgi:hypothetical protein